MVYGLGHISGTHINPGVTIGAWSIGKISWQEGLGYIVAQFIGASIWSGSENVAVPNVAVTATASVVGGIIPSLEADAEVEKFETPSLDIATFTKGATTTITVSNNSDFENPK